MKQETDENEFYEYIDKLKKIYEKNPKKATKEAKASLERLTKTRKQLLKEDEKTKLYICLIYIAIALIGLLNIKVYPGYLFGLVFFAAGSLIGLTIKGVGLIFLFSHGGTGLIAMMVATFAGVFDSPIMSDNPFNIYISLAGIAFLVLLATIITILYNLSDDLKEKRNFILIPLAIYGIAIFMAILLSKILSYKYGIVPEILWQ